MSRPKLDKRKPSKSVTLPEATIAALTSLGQGNLSLGIELAFQGYLAFRAMQGMPPILPKDHVPPNHPAPKTTKKKK